MLFFSSQHRLSTNYLRIILGLSFLINAYLGYWFLEDNSKHVSKTIEMPLPPPPLKPTLCFTSLDESNILVEDIHIERDKILSELDEEIKCDVKEISQRIDVVSSYIITPELDTVSPDVFYCTYNVVPPTPVFEGGMSAFYEYVRKNLKYPKEAKNNKIEGKVFLSFTVSEEGKVENVKVLKAIGYGCDKEAIRILENSPVWRPATEKDEPVKAKMSIPIFFKFEKKKK